MEVVLLVVAVIGIALVVVPRVQRRRRTSARRLASVMRRPSVRRRRRAPVAVATPVASWTPSGPASVEDDGWDDDLGWEGVDTPTPAAEGPTVERWRAADSDDDETWDDDLGWEGEGRRVASSNGHGPFNGNGNGAHPVTAAGPATRIRDVAASAPPAGLEWGTEPNAGAVQTAPRRKSRSIHPVLLVAVYAAAGIGLVVLASTFLLGGSQEPKAAPTPAKQQTPQVAPTATPDLAGAALDESDADAKAAAAEAAVRERVQKARSDFRSARTRAERAARRQAGRVAAAAREKKARAAAAKRRREAAAARRRREASPPAAPPNNSSPGPGYTAPTPPVNRAPTPRRRACEFCIG